MSETATDTHPGPLKAGAARILAGQILATLSRLEYEPLGDLLTEDAVLEFPFAPDHMPRRVEGRTAVIEAMSILPQLFSSFRMSASAMFASPDSDSLVVEAESSGTLRKGGFYANRYVTLFRFRGERVALWREYYDPLRVGPADRPPTDEPPTDESAE